MGIGGGGASPGSFDFEPAQAKTVFEGVRGVRSAIRGFGTASTGFFKDPVTGRRTIRTRAGLDTSLQRIRSFAAESTSDAFRELGRGLSGQLEDIEQGRNAFFNAQQALNEQAFERSFADLEQRLAQSGLQDSTVRGAFQGQLAGQRALTDLQTRSGAIQQANQFNLARAQTGQNSINSLFSIAQSLQNPTFQGLFRAGEAQDQNSQFNADQFNKTKLGLAQINSQLAQSQAQRRSSSLGGFLSGGLKLASLAFGR